MDTTKVFLDKSFFSEKEKVILQLGNLKVSTLAFRSGVLGLRVENAKGELIILPYQGQQIWRASFCGRDLTMKSIFHEPVVTNDFMSNYGGFMLHCGISGMGNPSKDDTHPLHGELPNMPYEDAYVGLGQDQSGRYAVIGGRTHYKKGFAISYRAHPEIKLYENATVFDVSMSVTNLRSKPMEYMYMCHINYLPVDGSRLVYSAKKKNITLHRDVPDTLPENEAAALQAYLKLLESDPSIHDTLDGTNQVYNPEIVFTIRYQADENGLAHCMQLLPDGNSYYVSFRPDMLPYGIRWIARTGDEDAIGIVLPATAEHKGYTCSKTAGDIVMLEPGATLTQSIRLGLLEHEEALSVKKRIYELI